MVKMEQKEKITIKAYAIKHRLSIFSVVKMIKAGELESETVSENGKDTLYILLEREKKKEIDRTTNTESVTKTQAPLKKDVEKLTREVRALREELEALKRDLK